MIELRELAHGDVRAVECIYGPESVRFLGRGPMDAHEAREYVAGALSSADEKPRVRYTLGLAVDGDLLGVVKLHSDGSVAAVSYVLRADTWGRGYATEGVRRILVLGTDRFGAAAIRARHHPDNPVSGRVLRNAGFVPTGVRAGFVTYALPDVWR
ncbi:GNAT family N-acetyltransferase [Streptomyces sp. XY431]|uniref:GNAT family N-acetyltransferase n=1 Tax=Streptomyces sp. XY431 TaxID=1415562 RepID=UPI0006AFDBD2|nr:GNAT family N-acetyltransferase [Streptomyces sp. XY431]